MSLPKEIRRTLRRFRRRGTWRCTRLGSRFGPGARPAVVAITIVIGNTGPAILLTRRVDSLHAHPGQYALPGGRIDPGESAADAARRELGEHLGIQLSRESVLGLLDDYLTRSGLVITPVVLWAGDCDQPARSPRLPLPAHVAEVFAIPFADLDVEPVFVASSESNRPVIRLPLRGDWLHAPTAAVLHQFREVVLHRRPTRVAHLDQPALARAGGHYAPP
ncbi:MAG: NUDIX hydrolase [Pseudonocardiaceae bacterium]